MRETDLLASRSPLLTLLGNSLRGRNSVAPEHLIFGDSRSHIFVSPGQPWEVSAGHANKTGLAYGAGSSLHQKTVGTRGTFRARCVKKGCDLIPATAGCRALARNGSELGEG